MKANAFSDYAQYYDLFYRGKDYAVEAARIDRWLRPGGAVVGSLIDLGCGTGRHAREFGRLGWKVTGVDASAEMVELARNSTPADAAIIYQTGTGAAFSLGQTVSAVVSLFHVVSYHTTPGDLDKMVANVRRHLSTGGRFIFDFWHGPGVLADPPTRRERTVDEGGIKITRLSIPEHFPQQCRIDVRYEMHVMDSARGFEGRITEVHPMRYYFMPEIEFILTQAGFQLEFTRAGISDDPLLDGSWYALVGAIAL